MTKKQWNNDTNYKIDDYINDYDYKSMTNSLGTQNAGKAKANSRWVSALIWTTLVCFVLCICLFIAGLAVKDDDQKQSLNAAGVAFFWIGVVFIILSVVLLNILIRIPLRKRIKIFDALINNQYLKKDAVYPESINMAMQSYEKWNASSHKIFRKKSMFNAYIGVSYFMDQLNLVSVDIPKATSGTIQNSETKPDTKEDSKNN